MDAAWLMFLAGLAVLPPIYEIHKQLILLGFALFQLYEGRLLQRAPRWGRTAAVVVKIALATLLIGHTGQLAINSRYYPIFYVPVVTAAMLFRPWKAMAWTAAAAAAYCSYLIPALRYYSFDAGARDELALRVFFFFLLAVIINRFVMDREAAEAQARQAQQQARTAERLAALGQLSAGLAHEIRNPLAVIQGSVEMLRQNLGGAPAVAGEMADYIATEVERVKVLVARFLDFARPLPLARHPTEVAPLLDQALEEARLRWPAARVEVERQYAGRLPLLPLDATLMERAFANLATNAYEAMGEAGGRLAVHAAAAVEGGAAGVRIAFLDSGPGVAGELRDQIFNPFFTTKPGGVGLGLAIVAKIVDQHGGQLRLSRDRGPGAVFEIFLPTGE
jgi:signal transduction histidine kinase